MLRAYAAQFVLLADLIQQLQEFKPSAPRNALLAGLPAYELDSKIRAYWPGLKHLTETIPLPSVSPQMARISDALDRRHLQEEIMALMAALRDRLEDDLRQQMFFHVAPEGASYYDGAISMFEENVTDAFPTASSEIDEAGKCLALGRAAACIFHMMRTVEIGLRALAPPLGITEVNPDWKGHPSDRRLSQTTQGPADLEVRKGVPCWSLGTDACRQTGVAQPGHAR